MKAEVLRLCRACSKGDCEGHKSQYVAGSGCIRKCNCTEPAKKTVVKTIVEEDNTMR